MKKYRTSIFSSIVFLIVGIMLFIKPDAVIKFVSYLFGGIMLAIGAYRTLSYYVQNKRTQVVNRNELAFGITAMVLGILLIFLANTIEFLLRIIVGIWVIGAGFGKIMQTFYTNDRGTRFYTLLVLGVILIGIGLYTILVSNMPLAIMGLFMIIYALIDLVSYGILGYEEDKFQKEVNEAIDTASDIIEGEVSEIKEDIEDLEKTKSKKSKKSSTKKKENK